MKKIFITLLLTLAAPIVLADTYAITGGIVHTVTDAEAMPGATVIIRDGRIVAVGKDIAIPEDAEVIDATGKVITPGFMDPASYIGLVEVGAVEASVDVSTESDRFTAAHEVADAINPRSTLVPVNRIEGITRAVSVPQSGASLIAGRSAIISLGSTENFLLKRHAAMHAVFGEAGSKLAGGSRGAAMLKLREALEDARDYGRNKQAWEKAQRREYSLSRLDLEAMQPVVNGEMPFVVSANRASDIEVMLRLAKDYGLKLVISGGAEAWILADKLAAAKVPVILDAYQNLPSTFEQLGSSLQNAAALEAAGVLIAFTEGESHNARNLKQAAGNAVAHGLSWNAALEALTVNPAAIYGVEDYGRLAPGYVADVVIWDGDPLETTTYAEQVFIDGRKITMQSRQTMLRDRYRNKEDRPQTYDKP